jgi:hypothetical protein
MSVDKLKVLWVQTQPWHVETVISGGQTERWISDSDGLCVTGILYNRANNVEHDLIVEMRRHLPQMLKAVEALELARSLVAEAMDVHIYNEPDGEEPDEDCNYAAFLRQADEILGSLK